jgi:hypothetical protein
MFSIKQILKSESKKLMKNSRKSTVLDYASKMQRFCLYKMRVVNLPFMMNILFSSILFLRSLLNCTWDDYSTSIWFYIPVARVKAWLVVVLESTSILNYWFLIKLWWLAIALASFITWSLLLLLLLSTWFEFMI